MDLNPTFGRQELFETLSSQGSRTSSSNKGNHKQQQQQSQQSHPDEAAIRLLGHKLSMQAHEGSLEPTNGQQQQVEELGWTPFSCFEAYHRSAGTASPSSSLYHKLPHSNDDRMSVEPTGDGTTTTHHHHHRRITKSLTMQCKHLYDQMINAQQQQQTIVLPSRGFHQHIWKQQQQQRRCPQKGLLASVMETTSMEKDTSSRTTQSISTKETKQSHKTPTEALPRGHCLTHPSDGTANDGEDNDDGNLLVYENDTISVPRKTLRMLDANVKAKTADFRILSLQGQGTFAQVFQCLHLQTNNLVALKVIKNKPAYTRQAAIEIDIYQTLLSDNPNPSHMVQLHAYFMHKNHLCLVFELLGQNLYEILKRRQFRGLYITNVQHLMRQVTTGIRELAHKNVVHCDLKPENILIVSEEQSRRVIQQQHDIMDTKTSVASSDQSSSRTSSTMLLSERNEASEKVSKESSASSSTMMTHNNTKTVNIKLIDFGSACFEGLTAHTYIQSRFYRSPEVLLGLPYDSSIDMWSLGCIAAELFLGLPILPGMHEHDQMKRM